MRRNIPGWIGGGLVVAGLVAMVAGSALGTGSGTAWGAMMGAGPWKGPGIMGAWGGGTVGQPPAPGSSSPAASPSADTVRMSGGQFAPAQLDVRAGTTVTWVNDDDEPHTVTATDGSWSSGYLAPGATYSRTFTNAWSYTYTCVFHPWMQATIIVH